MSSVVRCILTPHSKQRSASARAEPRLLVGKGVAHYRCCSSSRARASAVYMWAHGPSMSNEWRFSRCNV